MKVLHVSHHYAPCIGGVEKYIHDLCKALQRHGVEVEVLALDTCQKAAEKLPPREEIDGIPVTRVPYRNTRYYKIAPKVLDAVKESDADLLHIHQVGFLTDYLCLRKGAHGKRIVVSTHGGVFHTPALGPLKKLYFYGWCKWVLQNADRLIADSPHDEALFSPIHPRVTRIDNGIDYVRFSKIKKAKKDPHQVVTVGRLAENKHVDRLLEAAAQAQEHGARPRIIVVGSDPQDRAAGLQKKAHDLGVDATFLVDASEEVLEKTMASSTFFASASSYEAFGLAAVEGMAAGLIPVLNTIDSYSTFLEKKGTGFLTDFSNPQKAGTTLAHALALHPAARKRYAQNARNAASTYDWKHKAQEVLRVYEAALEESKGRKEWKNGNGGRPR